MCVWKNKSCYQAPGDQNPACHDGETQQFEAVYDETTGATCNGGASPGHGGGND